MTAAAARADDVPPALVANAQGELPLPWLAAPLAEALQRHRGHALLLHGAAGSGALPLALTLAQAWLCETGGMAPGAPSDDRAVAGHVTGAAVGTAALPSSGPHQGPCGHCGSCKLVQSRLHPDLAVLLPETLRRQHGWVLAGDKPDGDEKRKPSRQIRIDEVRGVIDWATRTSARGRGKVAVIHPAEALNLQSANALLKTLEEPPPGTRLLLTCGDPALLLPTVRSRCQHQRLADPPDGLAAAWLAARGVADAPVLLAACSGKPLDALALSESGIDAHSWAALPRAIANGQAAALAGWPVPRAVDALQKLCHDAMACASGAAPRYFPAGSVATSTPAGHGQARQPGAASAGRIGALDAWLRELNRVARNDEHPWNEGLLIDALVQAGAKALAATLGR